MSEAAFSPSSVWWCFISSPSSMGGAAFSPSSAGRCCLTFSFFGWCCGWGYFSLLFCCVVPLGLLRWVLLRFTLSFCVVLPSFSPFWWGCFLSPLLLGGVAWPPSLSGVALFPILLCGAAFLSLLPWVGLVSLPSSVGWCCPPSPPSGGDAFPPSSVGWCCLPSPPPSGGAPFVPLFCWVVPLGLPLWVVWPSLLLRGAAFLLLPWVEQLSLSSSLGWCCVIPSLFAWCCLPSPPSLGGSLSKRKKKTKLKTKKRNKEKQRGKQKEETKKKEKIICEFLNPIPDEKVHLSGDPPTPKKMSV